MTSIGETLRRERLRRGWSLQQVSREIKISSRLLESIESEQFDKLPGGVFTRSFVRQYAMLLGLDGDEIISQFQRQVQLEDEPPLPTLDQLQSHEEAPGSRWSTLMERWDGRSSAWPAVVLTVLVVAACAFVYSRWQRDTTAAAHPREAALSTPAPAPAVITDQSAPAELPSIHPPGTSTPAEASASTPAAAPAPTPAGSAPVQVSLTAGEETWLTLTSDGKQVFAGILAANQTKMVEGQEKVRVLLGNAGGVVISLNGKPIGEVGPKGQVRIVWLTAGGFQIVPRKPPTPESSL